MGLGVMVVNATFNNISVISLYYWWRKLEYTEKTTHPLCTDTPNAFTCEASKVCIPEFLTKDGYRDCLDGSDERE
jgi:hypothetical protein